MFSTADFAKQIWQIQSHATTLVHIYQYSCYTHLPNRIIPSAQL